MKDTPLLFKVTDSLKGSYTLNQQMFSNFHLESNNEQVSVKYC